MATALEQARRCLQQAKARVNLLTARERKKTRKLDIRRKIILGGLVLVEARRDPAMAVRVSQWIDSLSEKDSAAFQGWDLTAGENGHVPNVN